MCIYLFFEILIISLLFLNYENNKEKIFRMCVCITFIVFGFHNGDFEGDYPEYLLMFEGKSSGYGNLNSPETYELEWPYFYMCKLLNSIGDSPFVYIIGVYVIFFTPILMLIKRYSGNYAVSFLLLFVFYQADLHVYLVNIHRQLVANTLILFAIMIFLENNRSEIYFNKPKIIFSLILLVIALFSHSSSYFIVPTIILLTFFKFDNKKIVVIATWLSLFVGMVLGKLFYNYMGNSMMLLGNVEEIQRTTHYMVNEVYASPSASLYFMLPKTLLTFFFIYYSSKEELNTIFVRCLILSTIITNVFFCVPLISRSMFTLILLGIIGGIPMKVNYSANARMIIGMLLLFHIFLVYRSYNVQDFRLLPFHFIWE